MKKLAVILGVFFVSNVAMAGNQVIEETNYRLSGSVSDSDSGNQMSVTGNVRLPLAEYIGASITGGYSDFNGKNSYIDSSTESASLGLFVRKYNLGVINVSYGSSQSKVDAPNSSKYSTKSMSLNGIYYYNNFDIGLGRSKVDPDSGNSLNASMVGISYYVSDNLRIAASAIRIDQDDMIFSVSYQPEMFGNNIGVEASFIDYDTNDTVTISVAYYFGTRVSVKDRIRRY